MKSLSIVIPAMNEEETIKDVLNELTYVIQNSLKDYYVEVIVIDDHSTDKTAQIAQANGATVISNQYKSGKGNALRYGFERTTGMWIAMLDADGSHKTTDLPALLKPMEEGAGFVIGSRILGGSEEYTRLRAFGNLFLTYLFGYFHGRYLSDALNGYKIFRREIFLNYQYTSSEFEIEIELLANALESGYLVVEVPSYERRRQGGKAKSSVIRHGYKFLVRVIKEALKKNRNKSIGSTSTIPEYEVSNYVAPLANTRPIESLEQLITITRLLTRDLDLHDLLLGNFQSILEILKATGGSIVLLDENGNVTDGYLIYGGRVRSLQVSQANIIVKQGLAGWVIENRKEGLVQNTRNDPRWLRRPWDEIEETARSAISVPIRSNNHVMGVLTLVRPHKVEFTIDDLALLVGINNTSSEQEKQNERCPVIRVGNPVVGNIGWLEKE